MVWNENKMKEASASSVALRLFALTSQRLSLSFKQSMTSVCIVLSLVNPRWDSILFPVFQGILFLSYRCYNQWETYITVSFFQMSFEMRRQNKSCWRLDNRGTSVPQVSFEMNCAISQPFSQIKIWQRKLDVIFPQETNPPFVY